MSSQLPRANLRDIPPTTVRLPPELRDDLERAAAINSRSLSAEITVRLQRSMDRRVFAALKSKPDGEAQDQSQPFSDTQRMLLTLFDAMEPDRQLALLTLLKR